MFESSLLWTLTDYAMKRTGKLHGAQQCLRSRALVDTDIEHNPAMWNDLKGQFTNHIDEVNADLKKHGLREIQK